MGAETQEILIQIANISEKIDQKFLEQDKKIDQKFAEQDEKIEQKFLEQDEKMNKTINEKFEKQKELIEERFAEQNVLIDEKFEKYSEEFSEELINIMKVIGKRTDIKYREVNKRIDVIEEEQKGIKFDILQLKKAAM